MRLAFDRGTILVLDAPPAANLAGVAGLAWDRRVSAWRAPAWRHAALVNLLARSSTSWTDAARRVTAPQGTWRPFELRPYQDAALSAWELAGRHGVVVLPTGSGKTRVALAAMARTGLSSLCLVPTRVVLEQWCSEIRRLHSGDVGRLGDGTRDLAPITVATFESAYRHMHQIGDRFDLLVVDEAHHFGRGFRDEALEMAIAPARLGLTATPLTDESASARVDELLGPCVYELSIGDLAGGYLASFEAISLHIDLTDEERARHDALVRRFREVFTEFQRLAPEASWEDFARAASRTAPGRSALHAWRQARKMLAFPHGKRVALAGLLERHHHARVLVFTSDNETAYAVSRAHLIMPITCDIGRKERAQALERFRSGELHALVSARVLNEGIDVPDADVAIIVGGTQGEREHVQRVGRLLRPREGKSALIYELVSRQTAEVGQAQRRQRGLVARSAA